MLDDVPFEKIDAETLERLKTNEVAEGRTIDYKRDEPAPEKQDFLANLTSFANTVGGYLLYGVEADKVTSVPANFPGLAISETDKYEQRLNSLIRDNVDPRLTPPDYKWVDVGESRKVLVIRVQQSWAAPHAAMKHWRYYQRNSNGKQPMDTHELRNAFLLSGRAEDRFEDFCSARIDILARAGTIPRIETPAALTDGLILAIHAAPVSAMAQRHILDIRSNAELLRKIRPTRLVGIHDTWCRPNAEGFLVKAQTGGATYTYHQVFRSGAVETVSIFDRMPAPGWNKDAATINMGWLERTAVGDFIALMELFATLSFGPPALVKLSINRGKGFYLQPGSFNSMPDVMMPLEANSLLLPPLLVGSFEESASDALRPSFDAIWNAFGKDGSPNYDAEGNWTTPKPH